MSAFVSSRLLNKVRDTFCSSIIMSTSKLVLAFRGSRHAPEAASSYFAFFLLMLSVLAPSLAASASLDPISSGSSTTLVLPHRRARTIGSAGHSRFLTGTQLVPWTVKPEHPSSVENKISSGLPTSGTSIQTPAPLISSWRSVKDSEVPSIPTTLASPPVSTATTKLEDSTTTPDASTIAVSSGQDAPPSSDLGLETGLPIPADTTPTSVRGPLGEKPCASSLYVYSLQFQQQIRRTRPRLIPLKLRTPRRPTIRSDHQLLPRPACRFTPTSRRVLLGLQHPSSPTLMMVMVIQCWHLGRNAGFVPPILVA